MEIYIEDKDLGDLETCMEVADPGEDVGDNHDIWKRANDIVEGLRMLLPKGSTGRLRVVVE